ncbi:hypothetical protein DFQ30_002752 [Apophysomyces sp. BC1015]|nr:hypothetical protein DFQ30_002752 [Apophysomyces sp. BC1015]
MSSLNDEYRESAYRIMGMHHGTNAPQNLDAIMDSVATLMSENKRVHMDEEEDEDDIMELDNRTKRQSYKKRRERGERVDGKSTKYHHGNHTEKRFKRAVAENQKKDHTCDWCKKPWQYMHRCCEYYLGMEKLAGQGDKKEQETMRKQRVARVAKLVQESSKKRTLKVTDSDEESAHPFDDDLMPIDKISKALIDTGANFSAVDKNTCLINDWEIKPIAGSIKMAADNISTARIGITRVLEIKHNGHSIRHAFEVMALAEGVEVSVGTDIMTELGIGMTGLTLSWDKRQLKLEQKEDPHTIIVPNDSPVGTEAEREKLMLALTPYIDANKSIPKDSFCTVPESVIELDTPEGVTSFHGQHPLPYAMEPLIKETIDKWMAEGTSERAPTNTAWNSPLTLAPKKDAFGNLTGK